MAKRKAKRVRRQLTPEERNQLKKVSPTVAAAEKAEALAIGRNLKQSLDKARATSRSIMQALKEERESQGLSLADMRERCHIERSNLSALENNADSNPTILTLTRYASALGLELKVELASKAEV